MKWKTKKQENSTKPKLQSLKRVYKSLQTSGKMDWREREKGAGGGGRMGKGRCLEIEKSIWNALFARKL